MNNGMNTPQLTKDTVKNATEVLCENCGHGIFIEKMIFKKISALISPTGKQELFPMQLVVCDSCGLVSSDFNPQKLIPEKYLVKTNKQIIN